MDFASLPPEINSASMYIGPGSGPMLAAAAAWDGLVEDLYATASAYQSVISALTGGPWLGPASAAMAAAATPNVAWMTTVAGQAERTAVQARMAVAAYETAFAMTVPPPVIGANRSTLMALIATNVLGQNTPAIAATEALYDAMWAQDATAMYSYAANSASAATLPTFAVPQHTTTSAGLDGQAAAVGQATGTSSAAGVHTALSELTAATPQTLQSLSAPSSTATTASGLDSLTTLQPVMSATSSLGWITSAGLSNANQLKNLFPAVGAGTGAAAALPAAADGLAPATSAAGSAGLAGMGSGGAQAAASAAVGRAGAIGPLSVPQTWATGGAPIGPVGSALAAPTLNASSPVGGDAPASMLGPVPLAPAAGRSDPSPAAAIPRFDARPSVIPRSPAAG